MKDLLVTSVFFALSSGQTLLAANTLPEFKIESCRVAEEMSELADQNVQACFQDEQRAKDTLRQNWRGYDPSQKNHCRLLIKAGGKPSYVELLTCLEMKTVPTTSQTDNTRKKYSGGRDDARSRREVER
jgi:hypothetical protein